jgi:hypothetical protein
MADMLKVVMHRITKETPAGTAVIVVRDDGTLLFTRTRSAVGSVVTVRDRVVHVEGISGFYLADRVYDATEIGKGLGVVHG